MSPKDKPLVWLSGEVKSPPLSTAARVEAGFLLRRLQAGFKLEMPHSRPMPSIGPRCHELRLVDETRTWRIVYRIDDDAVIISDVFDKTTQATPKHRIEASKKGSSCTTASQKAGAEMDRNKRKQLEQAGWRVGSASDFLALTEAENALIDMKLSLGARLRKARERRKLTQVGLAKLMKSSQSRVAKMEAGDPSVSLDLLVQGLLTAGASRREIAAALARPIAANE